MILLWDLFFLTLLVGIYDYRYRRVPNWATFPLLAAGMLAQFPGTLLLWLASVFILAMGLTKVGTLQALGFFISRLLRKVTARDQPRIEKDHYLMGMGDVKLWLAVLWATPNAYGFNTPLAIGSAWVLSGLAQIALRALRKKPVLGTAAPGAWVAASFMAILIAMGQNNILIK